MKNIHLMMICIILLLSSSCSSSQLEKPPNVYFIYDGNEYITIRGTSSWEYKGTGIESDSPAPLELVNYQEESLNVNELDQVKIKFDVAPNKYSVYQWTDIDDKEKVVIKNNNITVPSDRDTIIYEVHAFWDQGDAHYAIKINIEED